MRRCARQLKRSARRHAEQLQCTCPGDPQTLSDELMKSTTCRTDLGANTAWRGRGKERPHISRYEQTDDGVPVVQMDYAFLHDTGDKEAKVTFFTMVDNSSGQMVATAVQKNGPDRQRNGTDRCGKKNTWQLREKRQPSSDRHPRKAANQTRTLNKHTRVLKPWSEP